MVWFGLPGGVIGGSIMGDCEVQVGCEGDNSCKSGQLSVSASSIGIGVVHRWVTNCGLDGIMIGPRDGLLALAKSDLSVCLCFSNVVQLWSILGLFINSVLSPNSLYINPLHASKTDSNDGPGFLYLSCTSLSLIAFVLSTIPL